MIGIIWIANIVIGVMDLVLFVLITSIVFKDYNITKARLMRNLLRFSIFMVVYALSSIIVSIYLSMRFGYEVAIPLFIVNIISITGFILLYNVINS
jgi:hypothetical protein